MSFRQKHQPAKIEDLVFRETRVKQIVTEYADGTRTKHLLLEGPTSSGKSETARLILNARLTATMGSDYSSIYHGQGFNAATINQIDGDWNMQMSFAGCAYSVIDEVDFAGQSGARDIRKFIDGKKYGTMICTTNNLHKLEPAFVSRFLVVRIDPPLPADWYARAVDILKAEGHPITMAHIQTLFRSFTGHARDFMDLVEDADIKLKRSAKAAPAQTCEGDSLAPEASQLTVGNILISKQLQDKVQISSSPNGDQSRP